MNSKVLLGLLYIAGQVEPIEGVAIFWERCLRGLGQKSDSRLIGEVFSTNEELPGPEQDGPTDDARVIDRH